MTEIEASRVACIRAGLKAENAMSVVRFAALTLRDRGCLEEADALLAYLDRIDHDEPLFDCTDAAHPAWWRAHDHVAKRFGAFVRRLRAERDELKRQLAAAIAGLDLIDAAVEVRAIAIGTPLPEPAPLSGNPCHRCHAGSGAWRNVAGRACFICDDCTLATTRCAP